MLLLKKRKSNERDVLIMEVLIMISAIIISLNAGYIFYVLLKRMCDWKTKYIDIKINGRYVRERNWRFVQQALVSLAAECETHGVDIDEYMVKLSLTEKGRNEKRLH